MTEAWTHLAVALPALEAGKHVLCEKPLALTVRSCQALIDAAKRGGAILATAENYRRDPPNRLGKAALEAGLIGHVHLMQQFHVGGDNRIIITPWRHMKDKGSIALDMGCHLTDIMQFSPRRDRKRAWNAASSPSRCGGGAKSRRRICPPTGRGLWRCRKRVTPTGEDSLIGTYTMKSGVLSQITYIPSGPGERWVSAQCAWSRWLTRHAARPDRRQAGAEPRRWQDGNRRHSRPDYPNSHSTKSPAGCSRTRFPMTCRSPTATRR